MPADLPLWTLAAVPELRLGARDGPGADVFGSIRDTEVRRDGVIVVADAMASEIRAFDAAGAHLWSTGRAGEGPGEFPRPPASVDRMPGDSVLVTHGGGRSALVFDPAGSHVRTIALDAFGIPDLAEGVRAPPSPVIPLGYFDDGTLVATPGIPMATPLTPQQPGVSTYQVGLYNVTGAARDTLGPFPLSEIVEHDGRTVTLTYNSGSGVNEGYRQKRWG